MSTFNGKVFLITGASSGIGAGAAVYFSKLGALVALVGRNEENLKKAAAECQVNGKSPFIIVADVTKDAEKIISNTIEHFGKLNVLVNNAGISGHNTLATATLDQFDTTINTNVRSIYHLSMLALPHLIKTKGNIVNISSVVSLRTLPGRLVYSMSKAALDQFTKCVALELAPQGVRVNSVNPGLIVTDFHKRSGMNEEQYEAMLKRASEVYPLKRYGYVDDVCGAIAYLASDNSSFVTGTFMPVEGGLLLSPSL